MDLAGLAELRGPTGQAALAAAAAQQPTDESFLADLTRLQKHYDPALAKAALETVLLRHKARLKFTRAERMYFTREALEQASGETIARYRAARYAGRTRVADLGCGIGGDAIGLSAVTAVTLVERDPLRLALAQANLAAYERDAVALNQDLATAPLPEADALWFDPARRSGGRRRFLVKDYEPALPIVHGWLARTPALGVKLSPGVDLAELAEFSDPRRPTRAAAELEFISWQGELKEAVLWFGPLRTAARRATRLPGPHTLTADPAATQRLGPPAAYLYEPDPAILRAGLVTTLAAQLNAHQLDADIAYLAADALTPTPWARAYPIVDAFPFQLKRLREYLRARGIGRLTVKKRGSPLEPEALIRQLKLTGAEGGLIFLTHVGGKPYVLISREAALSAAGGPG